jgi:hypothetical protein
MVIFVIVVGLVWVIGTTFGLACGLRIGREKGRREAERHWITGCNLIFDAEERRMTREYRWPSIT